MEFESAAVSTNLRDSIFASLYEWNYQLTADPAFAAMFHRGLQDFNSLTVEEKPRFMHTAYGFFEVFENAYPHCLQGSVGAEAWKQNCEIPYTFSQTADGRFYLQARKGAFDKRFIEELESVSELHVKFTHEIIESASAAANGKHG